MNNRTITPFGKYTDDELNLLKSVFAENMPLVFIIRKVMLQLEMSETEKEQWKNTFFSNPLKSLMRKVFLPNIDGDAPLNMSGMGSVVDLWMTIDLNNKLPDEEISLINSRKIVIDYLDNMLDILAGETENINKNFSSFDLLNPIELKARNTIIGHVEFQLTQIYGLAGYQSETPEETLNRLNKNSNK